MVQSIYKQIVTFIEGDHQKAFKKGLLAGMRYADRGQITDHLYEYKSPEANAFYSGLEIGQIIFSHYEGSATIPVDTNFQKLGRLGI